jgi:hypothetical protein
MYTVTLNQDNLAEGAEVQVHGLGVLVNGGTVEFTDEQVEFYPLANPRLVPHVDEETGIDNPTNEPGLTLEEAAEFMPGEVTVTHVPDKEPTPTPTQASAAAPTPPQSTPTAVPQTAPDGGEGE